MDRFLALRHRNGDDVVERRRNARRQAAVQARRDIRRQQRLDDLIKLQEAAKQPLYDVLKKDDMVSVRVSADKLVPAVIKEVGLSQYYVKFHDDHVQGFWVDRSDCLKTSHYRKTRAQTAATRNNR